jgi:hypothetical protein
MNESERLKCVDGKLNAINIKTPDNKRLRRTYVYAHV